MTPTLETWGLILAIGLVTGITRSAPVFWTRLGSASKTGALIRFFEYAAYAILGGLIAGSSGLTKLLAADAQARDLVPLTTLAITFGLSIYVKQPAVCLLCGLAIYLALSFVT